VAAREGARLSPRLDPLVRHSSRAATLDALDVRAEGRLPMNEPAFVALYARTAGPLFGYLQRLTGNRALAEDLMQDAYIRFLSATRVPDADDQQKHYLFRIATNLARDEFRRAKLEHGTEQAESHAPAQREDAMDVWATLRHVSARDRELLLLAYVEGLTHAEIAHVTGLIRASVRPLLFRARRRFAAVLAARPADGPRGSRAEAPPRAKAGA
jgi:RNA polymerase sigma-70 factor (ECF subfamily)